MLFLNSSKLSADQKNLWRNRLVAIAYSYQQNARPYLELLKATESFINPQPGERWLDLGCGSGRLIKSVWEKSQGKVGMIGTDISFTALKCAQKSTRTFLPAPGSDKIQLIQANFSKGLGKLFRAETFDGVTAGLCISYADHWDPILARWDNISYIELLKDVYALLRQKGSFVFSSNVPDYDYILLALQSWREILLTWKLPLALMVTSVMLYQSRWLRECSTKGRFHYLPAEEIVRYLRFLGFTEVKYKRSYAGQAWVFCATK